MGITPFFVENVSELQLCAIKLVTAVSFCLFHLLYPVHYIAVYCSIKPKFKTGGLIFSFSL